METTKSMEGSIMENMQKPVFNFSKCSGMPLFSSTTVLKKETKGNHRRRRWLIVFVFLMLPALSVKFLFPLAPNKAITRYVHDAWGLEENLPSLNVMSVIQDRQGYLWLGTDVGLVRFDGFRFRVFDKSNVVQISKLSISALYEDRGGILWIGTSQGYLLGRNPKNGSFTKSKLSGGNAVRAIHEDAGGQLWIRTSTGVYRMQPDTGKIIEYSPPVVLGNRNVSVVYEDGKGKMWVGTKKKGLYRLENDTVAAAYSKKEGLTDNGILSIYEDKGGCLWIGTAKGLNRLKEETITTYTQKEGLAGNHIECIHEDAGGNLWISTREGGLNRLTNGKITVFNKKINVFDKVIPAICEDHEGNLWLAATGGGLHRLGNAKAVVFTIPGGKENNNVFAIYQDDRKKLWFGTEGGLSCLKNGKFINFPTKDKLSGNNITALHEDREGALWIGTNTNGLKRLKKGTLSEFTKKDGLSDNCVTALHQDRKGTLWIGTWGGVLNRMKNGKFSTLSTFSNKEDLFPNQILALHEDRGGTLWIGTLNGLYRLESATGKITICTPEEDPANISIISFYEEEDGVIWLGTEAGLIRCKNGTFSTVTTSDGLAFNLIMGILDDGKGNLWLGGGEGICRVAKEQLADFINGRRNTVYCFLVDDHEGPVKRSYRRGGCKTHDGKLWFLTNKGVVMIDPAKSVPPPVAIESLTVDQKEISILPTVSHAGAGLDFPPGQGNLEITYTGLSFLAHERVLFKYKLTGFDHQWQDAGNRRTAYYPNLSPGRYTFRVKACNSDGIWNDTGAAVSFYIKPYFYQTYWFFILCGLAAVLLLFFIYRFLALVGREKELQRLVEERTRHLREAKNTAEEAKQEAESANQAKSEFLANMSHEIRTPMNAVLGFTQILAEQLTDPQQKKYLDAVSAGGKTLLGLINEILDLSRIEAGKMELHYEAVNPATLLNEIKYFFAAKVMEKDLEFIVETAADLPTALMLDDLRIRQVLINLVGNAVKFTHRGHVKISARIAGNDTVPARRDIVFAVEDTGIGIPPHQQQRIFDAFMQQKGQKAAEYGGTGLGLAISSKLTGMMNGEITVHSTSGKGSTFSVTLRGVEIAEASDGSATAPGLHDSPIDTPEHFDPATLLVADDNTANRELIVTYLLESGLEVMEATNGKEAVEMVKKHVGTPGSAALVLMDVKMPVMDGVEAARILKAHSTTQHIPIIIVTASALKEQLQQLAEVPHDGFLNKPVSKEELFGELKRFLSFVVPEPAREDKAGDDEESPPKAVDLQALLSILREKKVAALSQSLSQTMILNKLHNFSDKMLALAREYPWEPLNDCAKRFAEAVNSFDMECIKRTLESFPQLIEQLSTLVEGDGRI